MTHHISHFRGQVKGCNLFNFWNKGSNHLVWSWCHKQILENQSYSMLKKALWWVKSSHGTWKSQSECVISAKHRCGFHKFVYDISSRLKPVLAAIFLKLFCAKDKRGFLSLSLFLKSRNFKLKKKSFFLLLCRFPQFPFSSELTIKTTMIRKQQKGQSLSALKGANKTKIEAVSSFLTHNLDSNYIF